MANLIIIVILTILSFTSIVYAESIDTDSVELINLINTIKSDSDINMQLKAINAIIKFKERAVEALIYALSNDDNDIRVAARNALVLIGEPSLVMLMNAAADITLKYDLLFIFHRIGKSSLGCILNGVNSKNVDIKATAIMALGELDNFESISIIKEAYYNDNSKIKTAALYSLSRLREHALPATNEILMSAFDNDAENRRYASLSLKYICKYIPNALEVLRRLVNDSDKYIRNNAIESLGRLGPDSKEALQILISQFKIDIAYKDCESIDIIEDAIVRHGSDAVSQIDSLLREENADNAIHLIWLLRKFNLEAMPILNKELYGKNDNLVITAMKSIANIKLYNNDVLSKLIDLSSSLNPQVRQNAVIAIGTRGSLSIPALIDLLSSEYSDVREQSVIYLKTYRDCLLPYIDRLFLPFDSPREEIHLCAYITLRSIGEDALPALVVYIQDNESRYRPEAMSIIVKINKYTKEVGRILLKIASDENELDDIRKHAAKTYNKINK